MALMRAINAGRDSRVTMAQLARWLSTAGVNVVDSYLPSGNLIVEVPRTATQRLAEQIGDVVRQELGRCCEVLVLTVGQFDRDFARVSLGHRVQGRRLRHQVGGQQVGLVGRPVLAIHQVYD
jgi:uncharacterized protein (DUF1697 family)